MNLISNIEFSSEASVTLPGPGLGIIWEKADLFQDILVNTVVPEKY